MNDMLIALLAYLAQSFGSLGCAIIIVSLGIRAALLPLTIKLARRISFISSAFLSVIMMP